MVTILKCQLMINKEKFMILKRLMHLLKWQFSCWITLNIFLLIGAVVVLPPLRNPTDGLASTLQDNNLIISGGYSYGERMATVEKLDLR